MISAGQAHRAVPVTGALALSCAAVVEGSVVAACLAPGADPLALRIGTPSGIVGTGALRDPASGTILCPPPRPFPPLKLPDERDPSC